MYPGAGHEWFSVQHWVALQQDNVSVGLLPIDAPLVTFGDISRGLWPRDFGERKGSIFSYALNNYWHTNYRAGQGGRFSFHYVLTSAPSTDASALSHLGWQEVTPLEVDSVSNQDRAIPPGDTASGASSAGQANTCGFSPKHGSFLQADNPAVLLETWKAAEDGRGTILRFLNLSDREQPLHVTSPLLRFPRAWRTDAVERDQELITLTDKSSLSLSLHAHERATVRIIGSTKCTTS